MRGVCSALWCTIATNPLAPHLRLPHRTNIGPFLATLGTTGPEAIAELRSLLITPVQRVPRYKLLFQELLKHTPDWHPDFEALLNAVAAAHDAASRMNVAIQRRRNAEQLRALVARFPESGPGSCAGLLQPGRQLLASSVGLVRVCKHADTPLHLFLLDDVLCVAEKQALSSRLTCVPRDGWEGSGVSLLHRALLTNPQPPLR